MDASEHDFGLLEFSGGRFDSPGMPIAALLELRRFEVLVEDVAVALYLREHPKRARTSRGFRASFDLRVTEFREGCVEAVLTRPAADDTKLDVAANDYFERSRELVESEIDHLSRTGVFTPLFPTSSQGKLAVLGRGLRDSEVFGMKSPSSTRWARMDAGLRDLLSKAVADGPQVDEIPLFGQITGVESNPHRVSFFLADEQRTIRGTFTDSKIWPKLHGYTGYQQRAPMVALSTKVLLSQTGDPDQIIEIFNVEEALPENLATQIRKISRLNDGWFDGSGRAASKSTLDRVERLAQVVGTSKHPEVSIFPRPDGGVQFEWSKQELELDVLPSGREVAYAFAEERDADGEREFSHNDAPERVISWLYGDEDV